MGIGSGTAMLIGGLVGAGGSIAGAAMGSSASKNAADTQAQAADQAAALQYQASRDSLDFQKQVWQQQQQNLQPWLQSGSNALSNLNYLMGIGSPGTPASTTPLPTQPVAGTGINPRGIGSGSRINPQPLMANNNVRMLPPGILDGGPQGNPLGNLPAGNGNSFPTSGGMRPQPMAPVADPFNGLPGTSNVRMVPGGVVNPSMGGSVQFPSVATPQGVNPTLGAFGSLMQSNPYSTFTAPDALTEQNDPGYQARLKLGTDALERSAAARGGVLTGGTAQALNQFAQDYASNEYGDVYNRAFNTNAANYNAFNQDEANKFNRLAAISGVGQTTAQQLGSLGQTAANGVSQNLLGTAANMGQAYQNAGAANASGIVGSANAWSNGLGGVTGNISNMLLMQQLLGRSGGGGSAAGYLADSGYYG